MFNRKRVKELETKVEDYKKEIGRLKGDRHKHHVGAWCSGCANEIRTEDYLGIEYRCCALDIDCPDREERQAVGLS